MRGLGSLDGPMDALRLVPAAPAASGARRTCPPEAPLGDAGPVAARRARAPAGWRYQPGSIAARRAFVFGADAGCSARSPPTQMYLVLAVGGLTVLESAILGTVRDPVRMDRTVICEPRRRGHCVGDRATQPRWTYDNGRAIAFPSKRAPRFCSRPTTRTRDRVFARVQAIDKSVEAHGPGRV